MQEKKTKNIEKKKNLSKKRKRKTNTPEMTSDYRADFKMKKKSFFVQNERFRRKRNRQVQYKSKRTMKTETRRKKGTQERQPSKKNELIKNQQRERE